MKLKLIENEPLHLKIEDDKWKLSILTKLDLLKELIGKNPGGSGGSGEIHFPEELQQFLEGYDKWASYVEDEFKKIEKQDDEASKALNLNLLNYYQKIITSLKEEVQKVLDKPQLSEVDFTEVTNAITQAKTDLEEFFNTLDAGEGKKIASLQTSVDELKTQSAAHDVKVDSVIESLNGLDTKTNEIKTSIQNIKIGEGIGEKLTEVKASIGEANTLIGEVKTAVEGIDDTEVMNLVTDLGGKVGEIKTSAEDTKLSLNGVQSSITEVKGSLNEVKTSVENIDNTEVITAISSVSTKVTETQSSINNLFSTLPASLENSFTTTNNLVKENSSKLDTVISKEYEISAQITGVNEKVEGLSSLSSLSSLKDDMGTVSEKVDGVSSNLNKTLKDLETLTKREYSYSHEAVVINNLQAVYSEIITQFPDLKENSAVGFTTALRDGEVIPVKGTTYINGTLEEQDYSFNGENSQNGSEVVTVWYFGTPNLNLLTFPSLNFIDITIKKITGTITLSESFYSASGTIHWDGFLPPAGAISFPFICDTLYISGVELEGYNLTLTTQLTVIKHFISDITKISSGTAFNNFAVNTYNSFECPELLQCSGTTIIIKPYASTYPVNIFLPKIMTLEARGFIAGGNSVTIPASCTKLGNTSGGVITSPVCQNVYLYCNTATILDSWCPWAPTSLFLCENWQASINLSKAGSGQTKDWYIDLFTNKLATVSDNQYITLPAAISSALSDDEKAIATNKGWTLKSA